MNPGKVRVLCVDDDPATNRLHSLVLQEEADIEVVGTVSKMEKVLTELEARSPDVVLLDLRMDGDSSLPLLREVVSRMPRVCVVILSGYEEPSLIEELFAAGARGFVTKAVDVYRIAQAVRQALGGERPVVRSERT